MTHPPSRLCLSDLRHVVCASTGLWPFVLPHPNVSPRIRFLFVRPAFCFRLPPDARSPETPLPSANPSPCRVGRGLSPPSRCALPGAPKENTTRHKCRVVLIASWTDQSLLALIVTPRVLFKLGVNPAMIAGAKNPSSKQHRLHALPFGFSAKTHGGIVRRDVIIALKTRHNHLRWVLA